MGIWTEHLMVQSAIELLRDRRPVFQARDDADREVSGNREATEEVAGHFFLPGADQVTVLPLPQKLNSRDGQTFFCQVRNLLRTVQPHLVFDFSKVQELDAVGVHLLLQCLEEAMKSNGDLKLAAVPSGPASVLDSTGVADLFEIFDSAADASQSFHYLPAQNSAIIPFDAGEVVPDAETTSFAAD